MPQFYSLLKPVQGLNDTAYYIEDILRIFTTDRRKTFDLWLSGREVMMVDERSVIYKTELEEFFDAL